MKYKCCHACVVVVGRTTGEKVEADNGRMKTVIFGSDASDDILTTTNYFRQ